MQIKIKKPVLSGQLISANADSVVFTLNFTPIRYHQFIRMHYHSRSTLSNIYKAAVLQAIKSVEVEPFEFFELTIHRYNSRFLDFDNFVPSYKPIVDALIAANIIVDDSYRRCGNWIVDQFFMPKADGELSVIKVRRVEEIERAQYKTQRNKTLKGKQGC